MRQSVVSLFCGCGGKTLGAVQAGFTPVLSVEYDPAIAAVYNANFATPAQVADVLDVNYLPFAGADLLMASPVCTRASIANSNGEESELDISCAQAVARAIREIRPRWFLLENVAQYRKFVAFRIITDALDECGVWWDANALNSADFGVPQTRTRLIVRGSADGYLPPLPTPTPRKGWYDAVADLLPGCPDTKLADWQVRRLPENFPESSFVFDRENNIRPATIRGNRDPIFTITYNNAGRRNCAVPVVMDTCRTVALTTRCLARLQSFPDSFWFPEKRSLAGKCIGNAVPPEMARRIVANLTQREQS